MTSNLLMDFSIDKQNKKVVVTREFAASLSRVWPAWTQPELLDQWWAPKPWRTETRSMNFAPGGTWLYAMVGPEGERHWAKAEYRTIQPFQWWVAEDAFCNEQGEINNEFPRCIWKPVFTELGGKTTVHIEIEFVSAEAIEKYMELGFKEGFTSALENLDQLFALS